MARIRKRCTARGDVRWLAEVIRKRDGQVAFRAAQTFATQREAKAWARQVEADLDRDGLPSEALAMPLKELWREYLQREVPKRRGAESERYRLQRWIESHPLREKPLRDLRPADFARWRDERLGDGASSETVIRELGLLSAACT